MLEIDDKISAIMSIGGYLGEVGLRRADVFNRKEIEKIEDIEKQYEKIKQSEIQKLTSLLSGEIDLSVDPTVIIEKINKLDPNFDVDSVLESEKNLKWQWLLYEIELSGLLKELELRVKSKDDYRNNFADYDKIDYNKGLFKRLERHIDNPFYSEVNEENKKRVKNIFADFRSQKIEILEKEIKIMQDYAETGNTSGFCYMTTEPHEYVKIFIKRIEDSGVNFGEVSISEYGLKILTEKVFKKEITVRLEYLRSKGKDWAKPEMKLELDRIRELCEKGGFSLEDVNSSEEELGGFFKVGIVNSVREVFRVAFVLGEKKAA